MKPIVSMTLYDIIQKALLRAVVLEERRGEFKLFGYGHENRVTLEIRTASILRHIELPVVYISGYGANCYYPLRVFKRASKILEKEIGYCPLRISAPWRKHSYVYYSDN